MKKPIEQRIGDLLCQHSITLSTAESCTGGLIGHKITNMAGSSEYFAGAAVVYSNEAKIRLLGVQPVTLEEHGAVSRQTVLEMAEGVRKIYRTDAGLSVSGIAGPGGGTEQKPVGLVWFGINVLGQEDSWKFNFQGNRLHIKEEAAKTALELLEAFILSEDLHPDNGIETHSWKNKNINFQEVQVWGTFNQEGNLTPSGFFYQGVKHKVEVISRHWQVGDNTHYLVMVPVNRVFELIFKNQEKRWQLRDFNLKPGVEV